MLIVLVDDDLANTEFLARALTGHEVHSFTDPREARDFCTGQQFDLIIADQRMPFLTGIELVREIRSVRGSFVAIVLSAYTATDDLVEAVNSNLIYRYLVKPVTPEEVAQNALEAGELLAAQRTRSQVEETLRMTNATLRRENLALREGGRLRIDEMVAFHPAMLRLKELARLFAAAERPVLITGETGTGKELLARAIHELSPRGDRPFIVINSSSLPESLIESELFGFRRGAFTGAVNHKPGFFSLAEGGTLFLDEIGDLPQPAQAKLLRVLQFGTFYPLGGVAELSVSVRLISASNRDLRDMVSRGLFRKDLYYRIAGLELSIPPLRDRREDILPIMEAVACARSFALPPLAPDARERILSHAFPGNAREIENLVERLHLVCQAHRIPLITAVLVDELLPGEGAPAAVAAAPGPAGSPAPAPSGPGDPGLQAQLGRLEREIIVRTLRDFDHNISRAARALGLSRQGLRKKIERHGLGSGRST